MDSIIVCNVILNCSQNAAFDMFTNKEQLEKWLCLKANVVSEVGGSYELFWDIDNPEINSTLGCKILAIDKPNYLNFEWKGPVQFKDFMNTARPLTNVSVFFYTVDDRTKVVLLHTGWRPGEDWEQARIFFLKAWNSAFDNLKRII